MDGHIDLVIVLIDDAYHLLRATAHGRHFNQATEFSDTEINVHDIVTRLHLLQLFHCDGDLTRPCFVGLDAILMEPVEDLVVGEATYLCIVIDETLVHGAVNGDERHCVVRRLCISVTIHLIEDVAQTLLLLDTVGKDIDFVSLQKEVGERLSQQFKVLVEQRLWLGMESDGRLCFVCLKRGQLPVGITTFAETGPLQATDSISKQRRLAQHRLAAHVLSDLLLLQFGGTLQTLGQSL